MKSKNANKKHKNWNFEKIFLSYPKDHLTQKLCSYVKRCAVYPACRQTDTHIQTHTIVNTENILSGFREFFLQPIIKDRSNTNPFWASCGKIRPLVLNYPDTFVPLQLGVVLVYIIILEIGASSQFCFNIINLCQSMTCYEPNLVCVH